MSFKNIVVVYDIFYSSVCVVVVVVMLDVIDHFSHGFLSSSALRVACAFRSLLTY